MSTSLTSNNKFALPGATPTDKRLTDIQAVKVAIQEIDNVISQSTTRTYTKEQVDALVKNTADNIKANLYSYS